MHTCDLTVNLLQAKPLSVLHGARKHTLELRRRAVLREQQEVETSVGRRQALGGLAAIALDHQLQLLQAANRCEVAARHEGEEALLLHGVKIQQQLPEVAHVLLVLLETVIVRVPSQLGEVELLLPADDQLELCAVECVEKRGVAHPPHALAEGLKLPLHARNEQPFAVQPDELVAVRERDRTLSAVRAELLTEHLAPLVIRHHKVQAEGCFEERRSLLLRHGLLRLPLQQRAKREVRVGVDVSEVLQAQRLVFDLLEDRRREAHVQARHVVVDYQPQHHTREPEICALASRGLVEPECTGVLCHLRVEEPAVRGKDACRQQAEELARKTAFVNALLALKDHLELAAEVLWSRPLQRCCGILQQPVTSDLQDEEEQRGVYVYFVARQNLEIGRDTTRNLVLQVHLGVVVLHLQHLAGVGDRNQVPVGHEAAHSAWQHILEAVVRPRSVEGEL
mmetsp:Transcript_46888/g.147024  ORF Transcript_46888/g.147024 Transcript_46888/m.147024 type:complete len:452 (-) Transcript_46888:1815-3170(-)